MNDGEGSESVVSSGHDHQELLLKDDAKMARFVRKTAIDTIEEKRQLYANYKVEQKDRMISFLTAIFTDPLAPILNQIVNKYIHPFGFSIFEGMEAEKIKNSMIHKEEIEAIRKSWETPSIFKEGTEEDKTKDQE